MIRFLPTGFAIIIKACSSCCPSSLFNMLLANAVLHLLLHHQASLFPSPSSLLQTTDSMAAILSSSPYYHPTFRHRPSLCLTELLLPTNISSKKNVYHCKRQNIEIFKRAPYDVSREREVEEGGGRTTYKVRHGVVVG